MRRHAPRRNLREARMRRQLAAEQPVDPGTAELSGGQADAVHDDQLENGARGTLVPVRAKHLDGTGEQPGGNIDAAGLFGGRGWRGGGVRCMGGSHDAKMRPMPTSTDSARPATALTNAALAARDLAHVWHPCTQMKDHEQLAADPGAPGAGLLARGL